ncbi:uncharacterized protein STEHIDRAFT_123014 [Stereum hirsutum FP-91666 SS1]|uniref:uncharacterized protein n=1 Tax=Stereum hirsutum (strain FP-91666) TaxID=721885 RepID=UPI0004449C4F|nr:uncharacterized protein STEHIDRAFT_123014 [Stereum hirsutum FP-91666 SS1]EIM85122.1 hypothetical protein STEHIDRAFT_123014 [Stereum hirsutum FP-91666 SS1]
MIIASDDDDVLLSSSGEKLPSPVAQTSTEPPPSVPARPRTPPPPYTDSPDYASVPPLDPPSNSLDNHWHIVHAAPPPHLHQSPYTNVSSNPRRRLEKRATEPTSKRFIKTSLIALLLIWMLLVGWCVTSVRVRSYPDARGMGRPGQKQVSPSLHAPMFSNIVKLEININLPWSFLSPPPHPYPFHDPHHRGHHPHPHPHPSHPHHPFSEHSNHKPICPAHFGLGLGSGSGHDPRYPSQHAVCLVEGPHGHPHHGHGHHPLGGKWRKDWERGLRM